MYTLYARNDILFSSEKYNYWSKIVFFHGACPLRRTGFTLTPLVVVSLIFSHFFRRIFCIKSACYKGGSDIKNTNIRQP